MSEVLVLQSSSHPVRTDAFADALPPDYDVSTLELPSGTLHVRADDEIGAALAGKQAIFMRCGEITETVIETAEDPGPSPSTGRDTTTSTSRRRPRTTSS